MSGTTDDPPKIGSSTATVWLGFGAAAGIAVAVFGLLSGEPDAGQAAVDPDAVALVNERPISRATYDRAMGALASDSRREIDDTARKAVLQRLIDEELLVQRGIELGLAELDRKLRADLVRAVIDHVITGTAEIEPTPEQLAAFYEENSDRFAQPGALRVGQVFVRVAPRAGAEERAAAEQRANDAAVRLRGGESFEAVNQALGDEPVLVLPDVPLLPAKLRDYVGTAAAQAIMRLEVGATSAPVRSAAGLHVYRLLDRREPTPRRLEEIRDVVVTQYRRQAGDSALRSYLSGLRGTASIETNLGS